MKKIIALLLAGIMMALTLTACGSGGGDTTTPDAPPADTATTDTPAADTSNEAAAPASTGGTGPLDPMAEQITLGVYLGYRDPEDPNTKPGVTPEDNPWNDMMLDLLNIELDYLWAVPYEQGDERFQLSVASGIIPDLLSLDPQNFSEFAQAGMLMDLTEAYEKFASDKLRATYEYADNVPLEISSVDGKLLSVPWTLDPYQLNQLLFYRHDWIEALGLEVPDTIEKMEIAAQAFVDNNMGNSGTVGLGLQSELLFWGYDARGLFHAFGSYPGSDLGDAWINKGGQLVNGIVQPETKDALLQLRDWYSKGLINREFATMNIDQLVEQIVSGNVGMLYGSWWCYNWPLNSHYDDDRSVDWRAVILPAVGEPGTGKSLSQGNMVERHNSVSASAPPEAAEAMIKLLNFQAEFALNQDYKTHIESIYGGKPEDGFVYNWVPVRFNPANMFSDQYAILQDVLATGNESLLQTSEQLQLWRAYNELFNGIDDPDQTFGQAWGMWMSRAEGPEKGGGWGLTEVMIQNEMYVWNEYYGNPTPTEVARASTLRDMWREFSARFIMGDVAEDAFEKFVEDWHALGGADWTAEVNAQYQELQ
jgi:putative aldouronate transport system substrate-binding protein